MSILFSLLVALASMSRLADEPDAKESSVELIADADAIVPGQPLTLALRFETEEAWHIYWKDPGDSGMPPRLKWTVPPGLVAGELQYPEPKVLKTSSGTNYVHEGPVVLLMEIDTAGVQQSAGEIVLEGTTKWLVCDDELCLPDSQPFKLTLPVRQASTKVRPTEFEEWRKLIDAGRDFKIE
jgi:DsbC/DsbD-like thiol-disulfide interchange protein